MLQKHADNIWILTAFDGSLWKDVPSQKAAWVSHNLGYSPKRVICCRRRDKKQYANLFGQSHVLIDDMTKNVREFREAGGVGLHYTPQTHADVVASAVAHQQSTRLR